MARRRLAGAALAARQAKLARQSGAALAAAPTTRFRVLSKLLMRGKELSKRKKSCSRAGLALRVARSKAAGKALRACGGGMKKGYKFPEGFVRKPRGAASALLSLAGAAA